MWLHFLNPEGFKDSSRGYRGAQPMAQPHCHLVKKVMYFLSKPVDKLGMEISLVAVLLIERARALIGDCGFLVRHRVSERDFTRKRRLPFDLVMLLVLQKTVLSIQLHLHGFFEKLAGGAVWQSLTAGA